jgi:hypothetical protein
MASNSARARAPPGEVPFNTMKRRKTPMLAYRIQYELGVLRLVKNPNAVNPRVMIQPSGETGPSPHRTRRGPNQALRPSTGVVRIPHYRARRATGHRQQPRPFRRPRSGKCWSRDPTDGRRSRGGRALVDDRGGHGHLSRRGLPGARLRRAPTHGPGRESAGYFPGSLVLLNGSRETTSQVDSVGHGGISQTATTTSTSLYKAARVSRSSSG